MSSRLSANSRVPSACRRTRLDWKGTSPMPDESNSVPPAEPELRSSIDDIIAVHKKDVDRGMLRENLRLTVTERHQKATRAMQRMVEIYEAGRCQRGED